MSVFIRLTLLSPNALPTVADVNVAHLDMVYIDADTRTTLRFAGMPVGQVTKVGEPFARVAELINGAHEKHAVQLPGPLSVRLVESPVCETTATVPRRKRTRRPARKVVRTPARKPAKRKRS